uniref:Uncharacterized protein n=1 Tax=Arundo donax TaxID=35708 RepID=A0A0A9HHH8_ARUDO
MPSFVGPTLTTKVGIIYCPCQPYTVCSVCPKHQIVFLVFRLWMW